MRKERFWRLFAIEFGTTGRRDLNFRKLLDWRKVLIYSHRWLGIGLGVMFVVWSISGIVLMYAGLPRLTAAERLWRMEALDLGRLAVSPMEAAKAAGLIGKKTPARLRVDMMDGRPVYRLNSGQTWATVWGDTGEALKPLDAGAARARLARFLGIDAAKLRYDAYLAGPDLFTVDSPFRPHLPLHKFALDDAAGTKYYVSEKTGEIVMRTDRMTRFLGFSGYVIHRLTFMKTYFWWRPFWTTFVWCGLAMCLSGVVVGIWRFSPSARFRQKRVASHTPYASWMKWHHYAGLIFGVTMFTWMISGSMMAEAVPGIAAPFFGGGKLTKAQAEAVSGGPVTLKGITAENVRGAAAAVAGKFVPKELEYLQFGGKGYFVAYEAPRSESEAASRVSTSIGDFAAPGLDEPHVMVAVGNPEAGLFDKFPDEAMMATARAVMPGVKVAEATWLREYDDYYYQVIPTFNEAALKAVRPLPVLRVRFADAQETRLYLAPTHGQVARYAAEDRFKRWGYFGLHSLDFAVLLNRRPVWDIVVFLLLAGGAVLSATTLLPMWRRLERHGRRLVGRVTGKKAGVSVRPVMAPEAAMMRREREGYGD